MVYCVQLIACRHRLLDSDNNVGSLKVLRDAIAETLEMDDGDERLQWEYAQLHTSGDEGVVVRIQVVTML